MEILGFEVRGMSDGSGINSVQRAIRRIEGVKRVDVSLRPGSAVVQVDPTRVTPTQIEKAITNLGYSAKFRTARSTEQDLT